MKMAILGADVGKKVPSSSCKVPLILDGPTLTVVDVYPMCFMLT
jgi:hypothetical protein